MAALIRSYELIGIDACPSRSRLHRARAPSTGDCVRYSRRAATASRKPLLASILPTAAVSLLRGLVGFLNRVRPRLAINGLNLSPRKHAIQGFTNAGRHFWRKLPKNQLTSRPCISKQERSDRGTSPVLLYRCGPLMTTKQLKLSFCAAALAALNTFTSARALEVITVRSGQYLGSPGAAGDPDDIVNYYTENAVAAIATVFDAEFAAADTGPSALVVNPHPFWITSLPADPLARWINWSADPASNNLGFPPASALYSVPFNVTTPGTSSASLKVYFAVDDYLGDNLYGGPNPEGMYLNGTPLTASFGGNIGAQTLYAANVTVNQGLNYLYLYDREAGAVVSGLIFSATIVIPEPATWLLVVSGPGLALFGRRKRFGEVA